MAVPAILHAHEEHTGNGADAGTGSNDLQRRSNRFSRGVHRASHGSIRMSGGHHQRGAMQRLARDLFRLHSCDAFRSPALEIQGGVVVRAVADPFVQQNGFDQAFRHEQRRRGLHPRVSPFRKDDSFAVRNPSQPLKLAGQKELSRFRGGHRSHINPKIALDAGIVQAYDSNIRMTNRADTKTRILDTAEKLFGKNGFDATSLRDITTAAEVNLAAVNYHFQTKDSLIDAVVSRRLEPVNRRRLEMLDAAGPSPTLEQILEAFAGPVLEQDLSGVAQFIGRVLTAPDEFLKRLFKDKMDDVRLRFMAALEGALPTLSPAELLWRIHFTAGSMSHIVTRAHLIAEISGNTCDWQDRKALTARLVTFAAAGFRAPEGN
jgi:AcrR family transcriptional regulator